MIEFDSQNDFALIDSTSKKLWLNEVILHQGKKTGNLNYIFCNDDFLHNINVEFLKHNTLTDVISFDDTQGEMVQGEIYISTQRVEDNARTLGESFTDELDRVIVHGLLHFFGHCDKTDEEKKDMRSLEDFYLARRPS